MLRPTSGRIEVLGSNVADSASWSKVGALLEHPLIYGELDGRTNLRLAARLRGVPPARDPDGRERDPGRTRPRPVRVGPGPAAVAGESAAAGLGRSPAARSGLIILDEPTNALDPSGGHPVARGVAPPGGRRRRSARVQPPSRRGRPDRHPHLGHRGGPDDRHPRSRRRGHRARLLRPGARRDGERGSDEHLLAGPAVAVETRPKSRKARSSRVLWSTGLLLVLGLCVLTATIVLAARSGNTQLLAKLGPQAASG